jgi:ketosteroid isomerase-like protein
VAWAVQDVEMTAMHFHDDMVYKLHSVTRELPYTGVTRGRAAVRDVLFTIIKDFDYLKYDSRINSVEGDIVRAQVSFQYQHRQSGEILDGTRRLVFRLKDGFIVRMDRYHDDQRVDAFLRLTQHHMMTKRVVNPLALPTAIRRESCTIGPAEPPVAYDHDSVNRPLRREPPQSRREVS